LGAVNPIEEEAIPLTQSCPAKMVAVIKLLRPLIGLQDQSKAVAYGL